MSATYITTQGFLKKKTVFIRESDMQTLNSVPVTIIDNDFVNNYIIVSAFIHGAPNGTPGLCNFSTLWLTDGTPGTVFQARLNLLGMAGSTISTNGGYIFTPGTSITGQNGGLTTTVRPIVLLSNIDDPTGTGDYEIIVLYYEVLA
jgi:hypothetical protein